jgi:hypothetical protein
MKGFIAIGAACSMLLLGAARAQTFSFTVLADQSTPRPDGKGDFGIDWSVPVAYDGKHIAFLNSGASDQGYWISTPQTGKFAKLVDTSAKAPGGSGNFSNFYPPNNNIAGLGPKISGGKLYFWAEDAAGGNGYGLYWVSLAGGKPHLVMNYKTVVPEGGTLGFINSFLVSGDLALVNTSPAVYVGTTSAAAPVAVVDGATQILIGSGPSYYGCYSGAAIDGDTVAIVGTNCFDPSRGVNALFVGPYAHFASLNKLPVVSQSSLLPGDTNTGPHLDVIADNVFLSGNQIFFGAQDTFAATPFYGYYVAEFGAGGAPLTPSGSPITRVFDAATSGLTGGFDHFGGAVFNQGALALLAAPSGGATGIYIVGGDQPTLATTDLQRGIGVPVGFADGAIAFGGAGFFDSQLDYVAFTACGVAKVADLRIAKGAITAGANPNTYLQSVTVTNRGATPIAGPLDVIVNALPAGAALLDRTGVSVCTKPFGLPYIAAVAAGSSLAPGAAVTFNLDVYSPLAATFSASLLAVNGAGTP